jgi:hypothetical protein
MAGSKVALIPNFSLNDINGKLAIQPIENYRVSGWPACARVKPEVGTQSGGFFGLSILEKPSINNLIKLLLLSKIINIS